MFIKPIDFYNQLKYRGIDFFTGVPDSLLKDLCLCIDSKVNKKNHIITANEGNAIALAAGYHLSTKKMTPDFCVVIVIVSYLYMDSVVGILKN